jgi:hypothetical protein
MEGLREVSHEEDKGTRILDAGPASEAFLY